MFKRQSRILWKDIEKYRKILCAEQFGWLAEVYDGKKAVYKGTKKGYMSYYLMVDAIGVQSAANGIRVDKKMLERAKDWITKDLGRTNMLAEKDYVQKTLQAGGLITVSYDQVEDKQLWALTPYGADMFRVFFNSIGKEVGKPPTDWGKEFPKVMLSIFKFMGQLSDMMNGMNANMNGKRGGSNDPFGMEKMSRQYGGGQKKKVAPKKKKKRYVYRKKFKYKKDEQKQDDSFYQFGNKDTKYW